MSSRAVLLALVAALLSTSIHTNAQQGGPQQLRITGTVTDTATGEPLESVCVAVSVPARCFTATNAAGRYLVDLSAIGASPGSTWGFIFIRAGFETRKESIPVSAEIQLDVALVRDGAGPIPNATTPPVVQSPPPTDAPPSPSASPRQKPGSCSLSGG